jgi:hypothetical protein
MSEAERRLDEQWARVKRLLLTPTGGKGGGYDNRVSVKWHGRKTPESLLGLWTLLRAAADEAIVKMWEDAA